MNSHGKTGFEGCLQNDSRPSTCRITQCWGHVGGMPFTSHATILLLQMKAFPSTLMCTFVPSSLCQVDGDCAEQPPKTVELSWSSIYEVCNLCYRYYYNNTPNKHSLLCKCLSLQLWQFCKVLHVTVHHAKFLCGDSIINLFYSCIVVELIHNCNHTQCHNIRQQSSAGTCLQPCPTVFFACSKNNMKAWQQGYWSVCFVAWYCFLHCQATFIKWGKATMQVTQSAG